MTKKHFIPLACGWATLRRPTDRTGGTMSEHTQGPWIAEFSEYGGYDCMSAAWTVKTGLGYNVVAVDCNKKDHTNNPVAEANARLIAEAPAMAALLKHLEGYETDSHFVHSIHPDDMAAIRTILARIGGAA